jgi:hypothetical protein
MIQPAIAQVRGSEQSAQGAIRSRLHWGDRTLDDWNCFTTALALRHGSSLLCRQAREMAFDFLLGCRHSDGAFGFWPPDGQPSFIRERLSSDCDDSAIAAMELARAGRWSDRELRRLILEVLVRRRLPRFDDPRPPWLRPGVFLTWLAPDSSNMIVDCCANANVAALLAFVGMTHLPGYADACEMIEAGLRWAGNDKAKARALCPYYPEPVELRYALEHAVACGARALEASSRLAARADWAQVGPVSDLAICGSSYGGVFWTAPVLQGIRSAQRLLQH